MGQRGISTWNLKIKEEKGNDKIVEVTGGEDRFDNAKVRPPVSTSCGLFVISTENFNFDCCFQSMNI